MLRVAGGERSTEELLREVEPRSTRMIAFTVVVTLFAALVGLFAFGSFMQLVGPPVTLAAGGPPTSRRAQAWFFGSTLVIFLFFLRVAAISVAGVVTNRAGRFPLVPWWLAGFIVVALLVLGAFVLVTGLERGDRRAVSVAVKLLVTAGAMGLTVPALRRAQLKRAASP